MIDLGDELAGYGEKPPSEPTNPEGMPSFGRLTDLQAGGFNVKPQWSFAGPGSFTLAAIDTPLKSVPWLTRIIGGYAGISTTGIHIDDIKDDSSLEIEAKRWLPGDPE